MTTQQKGWCEQLRKHAKNHYEQDGWDYLIECWDDNDIVDSFSGATTWAEAFKYTSEVLLVMDSRRKDVEGEIF